MTDFDCTNATQDEIRSWLARQVAEYRENYYPRYEAYAQVLAQVLQLAARQIAPLAIVQTREKSLASFTEKALRKCHKYSDPVNRMTDLCGGRVIARTRSEVTAFSEYIKRHFDIDEANSLDVSERLKPTEFGYRSIHYIVTFREDIDYGVEIPEVILGLKAEIQVRTLVEHAYADFGHDLTYKGAFELPAMWQRELACVAATLEEVDQTFSRSEDRMRAYTTSYGKYLSPEERKREMDMLGIISEAVPDDAKIASQYAKLSIMDGKWDEAIAALSPLVDLTNPETAPQPILRDLGVALCKKHHESKTHVDYRRGQRYLEIASAREYADVDAICSYAGTWKGMDEQEVYELYRRAYETDPHDAYALENYLECELMRGVQVLGAVKPNIERAARRCESHINVGINLPWALFSLGKFHLLLGMPHESLDAYAKAVQLSPEAWTIATAHRSLERLEGVAATMEGYEWIRRLLLVGKAIRILSAEDSSKAERLGIVAEVGKLAGPDAAPLAAPVRIIAGATHPREQEEMSGYSELLMTALTAFDGAIVSGGTTQGISGLVGDAAQRHGIRAVAYLPANGLDGKSSATVDHNVERFSQLRYTDGDGFSPLEPLQFWIDRVASANPDELDGPFNPAADVRLLGISGGIIAAAEYRIALALGATVGIISKSGGEGERIFSDVRWRGSKGLVDLPRDAQTVRTFLGADTSSLDPRDSETIARVFHDEYRAAKAASSSPVGDAMKDWKELEVKFRESNLQQARHIEVKLRAIGCRIVPLGEAGDARVRELEDVQVERLAEMEHGRFNTERILDGWTYGPQKDDARKISPYLIPWSELTEEIRDYDRVTVKKIPDSLESVGLAIVRDD